MLEFTNTNIFAFLYLCLFVMVLIQDSWPYDLNAEMSLSLKRSADQSEYVGSPINWCNEFKCNLEHSCRMNTNSMNTIGEQYELEIKSLHNLGELALCWRELLFIYLCLSFLSNCSGYELIASTMCHIILLVKLSPDWASDLHSVRLGENIKYLIQNLESIKWMGVLEKGYEEICNRVW